MVESVLSSRDFISVGVGEGAIVDQICEILVLGGKYRGHEYCYLTSLDIKADRSESERRSESVVAITPHF